MRVYVSSSNGLVRTARPPRSCSLRTARSASVITPSTTETFSMPSTLLAAAMVSRSIFCAAGQPTMVSFKFTTALLPSTSMSPTMPSSVIGLRSSGSITASSARRILSCTTCSSWQSAWLLFWQAKFGRAAQPNLQTALATDREFRRVQTRGSPIR